MGGRESNWRIPGLKVETWGTQDWRSALSQNAPGWTPYKNFKDGIKERSRGEQSK